jgi:probable addiction module antidote protein
MKKKTNNKRVSSRSVSYRDGLLERLKDPRYAAQYIAALIPDPNDDEGLAPFLIAIRDACEAFGVPMTEISRDIKIDRAALYRALSATGNPTVDTLNKVLSRIGLRLSVDVAESATG